MQLRSFKNAKASGGKFTGCFPVSRKKLSSGSLKVLIFILCVLPYSAYAQKDTTLPDGTDGLQFKIRAADTVFLDKKSDLEANEFEGKYATFRVGMGYIGDFTAYSQNAVFKQQMDSAGLDLTPHYQTRDFRILGSGRILKSKRYLAYKFAYMYDGDKKVWMLRETGLTIGVPELKGNFFVGRTKEGFSTVKIMNGHSGLTNERAMATDAIPILADGIKYMGYYPKSRTFLNVAYFNDFISKGQSFSTFSSQWVGRAGWLPVYNQDNNTVLHIAGEFRYGKPLNGEITLKSRPESNPTPQLINTGVFAANKAFQYGGEIYYRRNRFMIGSEIVSQNYYSNTSNNHQFNGGDVVLSYFFTKNVRAYNTVNNIFGFVPVKKSVFNGGWGAIEGVLHVSTMNLNDKDIRGGQMTRITPMVNWYLSKWLRWELIYGYGILNRYGLKGNVNFYETRLQVTLM